MAKIMNLKNKFTFYVIVLIIPFVFIFISTLLTYQSIFNHFYHSNVSGMIRKCTELQLNSLYLILFLVFITFPII